MLLDICYCAHTHIYFLHYKVTMLIPISTLFAFQSNPLLEAKGQESYTYQSFLKRLQ